jgi:CHAT domain-containing protein
VLTGIGGWSESFLKKSASAFIGTLWSVGDTTALNFTKSLYTYLKAKKPLDESVKLARLDVKNIAQETGDPSWLAYSLYAQPNATFELV